MNEHADNVSTRPPEDVIREALQDGAGAGDARYIYPDAWAALATLTAQRDRAEEERHVVVESMKTWCARAGTAESALGAAASRYEAAEAALARAREALAALVKEADSYVGIGHALADEDAPLIAAIATARAALVAEQNDV